MANALGIISYNDSSVFVEGMQEYRPLAAFNFMGRYRLVDFPISNMTNSGMDEIHLFVNGNPKPVFEHIGRGRQYNINSKHGNLEIVPLWKENGRGQFTPDVESYYDNLHSIMRSKADYVIVAPINILYKANFDELLENHIESGADISVLYANIDDAKDNYIGCDTLALNKQKCVAGIEKNLGKYKNRTLSLQTYIMSKELFVEAVNEAKKISSMYWFKDIINDFCSGDYDVRGISYRGKFYYIYDLTSYYQENLDILKKENLRELNDPKWPIYTRTYDSSPTIYLNGGSAQNSLISNSCEISGSVTNSVIGRGVKIGHDAVIDNCVILPDVTIAPNANLSHMVIDKFATITKKKVLAGIEEKPLYIARREQV